MGRGGSPGDFSPARRNRLAEVARPSDALERLERRAVAAAAKRVEDLHQTWRTLYLAQNLLAAIASWRDIAGKGSPGYTTERGRVLDEMLAFASCAVKEAGADYDAAHFQWLLHLPAVEVERRRGKR